MKIALFSDIILAGMVLVLTACSTGNTTPCCSAQTVIGSGTIASQQREVGEFSKVELKSLGNLTIKQGDKEALTITTDENLIPYITTEVTGETLEIGMKPNLNLKPSNSIEYTLVVKSLSAVKLSGLGNISADELSGDDLSIILSGSGNIDVEKVEGKNVEIKLAGMGKINTNEAVATDAVMSVTGSGDITAGKFAANSLDLTISGYGHANLSGTVNDQKVRLTGSGSFNAGNLQTNTADVTISGIGDATVWAEKTLDLMITGNGTINYYGQPIMNQKITGVGKVQSLGIH